MWNPHEDQDVLCFEDSEIVVLDDLVVFGADRVQAAMILGHASVEVITYSDLIAWSNLNASHQGTAH